MSQKPIKQKLSVWHSFFKWMGICFVTLIIGSVILVVFFASKFLPIIKIDENSVKLFGGTISITDGEFKSKNNNLQIPKRPGNLHNNPDQNLENFI